MRWVDAARLGEMREMPGYGAHTKRPERSDLQEHLQAPSPMLKKPRTAAVPGEDRMPVLSTESTGWVPGVCSKEKGGRDERMTKRIQKRIYDVIVCRSYKIVARSRKEAVMRMQGRFQLNLVSVQSRR
jgi:hypothetical protein